MVANREQQRTIAALTASHDRMVKEQRENAEMLKGIADANSGQIPPVGQVRSLSLSGELGETRINKDRVLSNLVIARTLNVTGDFHLSGHFYIDGIEVSSAFLAPSSAPTYHPIPAPTPGPAFAPTPRPTVRPAPRPTPSPSAHPTPRPTARPNIPGVAPWVLNEAWYTVSPDRACGGCANNNPAVGSCTPGNQVFGSVGIRNYVFWASSSFIGSFYSYLWTDEASYQQGVPATGGAIMCHAAVRLPCGGDRGESLRACP
jgi:hypothetical protein